jgi:hypothetical protein
VGNIILKKNTVHTARTMMFLELSKVMDFSVDLDNYQESMKNNVFGKKSQDGIKKTSNFLTQLYGFDISTPQFKVFKHFWMESDVNQRQLISFVFAFKNDYLLQESLSVLANAKIGDKVAIELFMENIEKYHPKRFTDNTLRSVAQNIASSWKQSGFITGKVKNTRTQPNISYKVVAFAMLLSYLEGDRGDFIMHSNCVNALCIGETMLRDLAVEASKRDFLQYQYAGSVTSISFDKLINKIVLDAI